MKCFKNGMQTELIRSSHSKSNKRSRKREQLRPPAEAKSSTSVRSNEVQQVRLLSVGELKRILDCRFEVKISSIFHTFFSNKISSNILPEKKTLSSLLFFQQLKDEFHLVFNIESLTIRSIEID